MKYFNLKQLSLYTFIAVAGLTSCKKDPVIQPEDTTGIRPRIEYNSLTANTPYKSRFLNNEGDSIVDLSEGNTKLQMFLAFNYYLGSAVRDSKELDATLLKNMFTNTGNPFTDISSLNIQGDALNQSGLQFRNILASSLGSQAETERMRIENLLVDMANLSKFFDDTAALGKPGKAGNYLADAKGIEIAQVIQKSLIGAAQLDYIGNVLLNTGLQANNSNIVSGKKYTELEHNWDLAYGFLTLNSVFLENSTDATKGTSESFIGSYIWEYNKADYAKVFPAFLKGRAAVANNDINEVKAQAEFIRRTMEKAIASAAVGYLNKWKTGSTEASRIHAIGEGIGFIYSLRYCSLNGGNQSFSDDILTKLTNSTNGYWDLTAGKINEAINSINSKFNL